MKDSFANDLFLIRMIHEYTQKELAEALEVTSQTISNWECGRTEPPKLIQKAVLQHFS